MGAEGVVGGIVVVAAAVAFVVVAATFAVGVLGGAAGIARGPAPSKGLSRRSATNADQTREEPIPPHHARRNAGNGILY